MGWEEILDAEGADMADAYNDSLPEETYETVKVYDPEQDKNCLLYTSPSPRDCS